MSDVVMNSSEPVNQFRETRLQKVAELRTQGVEPYPYGYDKSHSAGELQGKYASLENGQETEDVVFVAGRIHSYRNSGMFIDLQDDTGKIQIFSHKSALNEDQLKLLDLLDLGDFIGVKGIMRKTPRGEVTVNALEVTLLTKSILPPPEKYHGLNDIETRYRQRYLDLIANQESRDRLKNRSQIIRKLRELLHERGFMEVETPMLQTIPGGALARPFITHHNALNIDQYLRIAPELYLKRLIVGGVSERLFELNRCFRNEGLSPRHNPEFTMVEIYQAYADYHDMMDLAEHLISTVAETVLGTTEIAYGDHVLSFKGPWKRATMVDLVKEYTGLDFETCPDAESAQALAKSIGVHTEKSHPWGKVVETVFGERVENNLIQPIHVTDLPRDISPLAKGHRTNPRLTERFETFCNTWEIANAFSELTDPIDQKDRFLAQDSARDGGDIEAHHMDHDFVTALEYGMPPTGGLGIGIDRLIMLLTNAQSIRDVIAFPTMKPRD